MNYIVTKTDKNGNKKSYKFDNRQAALKWMDSKECCEARRDGCKFNFKEVKN